MSWHRRRIRVEDCQIRVERTEVSLVTGNKPACLHGVCADENIGNRALYRRTGTLALYMFVPRPMGFENDFFAAAEIYIYSKAGKDNILLMHVPQKRRRQLNVC